MPTITKNDIQKLVTAYRLPLLFEIFSTINRHNQNPEILINQARYSSLRESIRKGTIRREEKMVQEAQIIQSLLEIINGLPDHPYEISNELFLKLKQPTIPMTRAILGTGLLLALVIIWIYFYMPTEMPQGGDSHKKSPKTDTPLQQEINSIPPSDAKKAPILTLKTNHLRLFPGNYSKIIINTDTLPLAFIDFAYLPGKEQEANYAEDACCYQFEAQNLNGESISIQSLFVELSSYRPLPENFETMLYQPFDEETMVYILMKSNTKTGSNIYKNSFYVSEGQRKTWGGIRIKPNSSELITARINGKDPGIYTFQLGIEYYSANNDSLVRKYILPSKTTWVYLNRPEE